ncbi:hypothetical protein BUALT_Bualt10G0138000 [Buddleja alternifolia]|uniref:SNRNP25 ubiquitin-like domain-containing protein n=1 Tax=Buddleja alternifolia TaxID=168488 RepID=A0AAV6X6S9_9LAMI|nr:hypothetical protein BUALT_Bualt10G0138000 [Buddleja alternifolia]
MIEIVESGDDYDEPRFSNGSMSCVFPPLIRIDAPRKSLSFDKLPQEPLRLIVLKLDGSSFGIELRKKGTVGELKRAVEAAFGHLPKKGPGRVSWPHVWGQFCLCHEGQKLLIDSDYIGMLGIKDGDELQFIRHASETYDLVRIQSEREEIDSDDEPTISDGRQNSEKDDSFHIEIVEENKDEHVVESDNCCVISHCEYRLTHMLRGWFPYRKLTGSDMTVEERSSSRSSCNILASFKNVLRFSSNKYNSGSENWKGK